MTITRAKAILNQFAALGEDFLDPKEAIKPVLDKLKPLKFPTDKARKDWIARIQERFGKDVADLVDQYAGKDFSSYPDSMTPALKSLIDNVNGIIRGNPGF